MMLAIEAFVRRGWMVYVRVGSPLEASKRFPVLLSFWMGNEPRQQRRRWMSTYTPVHGVQGWVGDVCSVNIVVHEGAYRTGRTDGQKGKQGNQAMYSVIHARQTPLPCE
jgi:hypothetical protein